MSLIWFRLPFFLVILFLSSCPFYSRPTLVLPSLPHSQASSSPSHPCSSPPCPGLVHSPYLTTQPHKSLPCSDQCFENKTCSVLPDLVGDQSCYKDRWTVNYSKFMSCRPSRPHLLLTHVVARRAAAAAQVVDMTSCRPGYRVAAASTWRER